MSETNCPHDKCFGGKVIVFGGDFRQILPVIPKGSRSDIVNALLNASYIWDTCKVFKLTRNMRLQQHANHTNLQEVLSFAKWILDVGDGNLSQPHDGIAEIDIPKDILIQDFDDPIEAIVAATYPDFAKNYQDIAYLSTRAIFASTTQAVDSINQHMLSMIPGDEKEYLSSDSIDLTFKGDMPAEALTTEFSNTLCTSGLPLHRIVLKVGSPIMLLRNIDQSEGLCNGTRLIVTKLADHVIEAKVLSSSMSSTKVYISRMSLSPSESPWPFKLIRRQFPIFLSYAMTINKSQGQSLSSVGIYLPKPVFTHGQLYVAISRVQSKQGLKILPHDKDGNATTKTTNVVYKEVFQNIL